MDSAGVRPCLATEARRERFEGGNRKEDEERKEDDGMEEDKHNKEEHVEEKELKKSEEEASQREEMIHMEEKANEIRNNEPEEAIIKISETPSVIYYEIDNGIDRIGLGDSDTVEDYQMNSLDDEDDWSSDWTDCREFDCLVSPSHLFLLSCFLHLVPCALCLVYYGLYLRSLLYAFFLLF